MTPTLRRLDDRERYWGLTWPWWVAAIAGAGALYGAVRLSPLPTKPTITVTLFILAFVAMALYAVSGQALSPGRHLLAIVSYRRRAKLLALAEHADRRGLVLHATPNGLASSSADDRTLLDGIDDDVDVDVGMVPGRPVASNGRSLDPEEPA